MPPGPLTTNMGTCLVQTPWAAGPWLPGLYQLHQSINRRKGDSLREKPGMCLKHKFQDNENQVLRSELTNPWV